jgi:hypothetical protein
VQENVIDFPPFVHRKPGADNKAPHDELERFESTRRYTITAATQIMSSPSYWAPKLGTLNPGETVNVEAKIGVWLRIRNRAGNISYILAQDAAGQ